MSGGMLKSLLAGMDGETASQILSSLDDEMIEEALETGIEQELVPHLEAVRERASEDDLPPQEVRQHYESLSAEEQNEKFHKAAADIMGVVVELREKPLSGMRKLKGRLRDPWTVEALLLIFDHEDVPDEVSTQQKEFASAWLKYAGLHIIPEVYERDDLREMVDKFYPKTDVEDVLDEHGVEGS